MIKEKKYFITSVIINILPYFLFLDFLGVIPNIKINSVLELILGILGAIIFFLPTATFFEGLMKLSSSKEKKYIIWGLTVHILYVGILIMFYLSTK